MKALDFFSVCLGVCLGLCSSCGQEETVGTIAPAVTDSFVSHEAESLGLTLDEFSALSPEAKAKRAAMLKLVDFLSLNEGVYFLDISQEEAEKKGVSLQYYEEALLDIERVNGHIAKMRSEGKTVVFPDEDIVGLDVMENGLFAVDAVPSYTDVYKKQEGGISTTGTNVGHDDFIPQPKANGVYFTCVTGSALLTNYTCSTKIGGVYRTASAVGGLGKMTLVGVPFYVPANGGQTADLYFSTNDEAGGSCKWKVAVDNHRFYP